LQTKIREQPGQFLWNLGEGIRWNVVDGVSQKITGTEQVWQLVKEVVIQDLRTLSSKNDWRGLYHQRDSASWLKKGKEAMSN